MQVFKVGRPWTGTVGAYSSIPICVRFQPIEEKSYRFSVPLTFGTFDCVDIEFIGKGVRSDSTTQSNRKPAAEETKIDDIPIAKLCTPPQWLARLSHGVRLLTHPTKLVVFNDVVLLISTRVCFLAPSNLNRWF